MYSRWLGARGRPDSSAPDSSARDRTRARARPPPLHQWYGRARATCAMPVHVTGPARGTTMSSGARAPSDPSILCMVGCARPARPRTCARAAAATNHVTFRARRCARPKAARPRPRAPRSGGRGHTVTWVPGPRSVTPSPSSLPRPTPEPPS